MMLRWCGALWMMLALLPHLSFAAKPNNDIFQFSGYVDTSYNYLVKNHQFISGVNDRLNDLAQNGITFQQTGMTFEYKPTEGLGGLLNVIAGRDAYTITPLGWDPYFGSQTLALVIPEAYAQFSRGQYALLGGVFNSFAGAESYDPTKDVNFSRSILDGYAEPGIMIGVRGLYTVNEKVKLNVGLTNGWNGIRVAGKQKSLEWGAAYTPNTILSFVLQGMAGEQHMLTRLTSGSVGMRNFVNLIVTCHATSELTFMASGDYASQTKGLSSTGALEDIVWQGVTGYMNNDLNDKWRTSLRGEVYDDRDGYTTGVRQNWRELTLTLAYMPIKHMELRAETRRDFSNVSSFMNETGPGTAFNQQSYALEALYQF
jgi:hypothetical protein